MSDELDDMCRRIDAALASRAAGTSGISRGAIIRRLYPVILKYRSAGLTLEDIAEVLQAEGYPITPRHLTWHLGAIKKERGALSSTSAQRQPALPLETQEPDEPSPSPEEPEGRETDMQAERALQQAASSDGRKEAVTKQPAQDRDRNSTEYTAADPLALEGQWLTGAPMRWWTPSRSGDPAPSESPLPMPLRYPLPEELRPEKMPPVPEEWGTYELKAMPGDKLELPDTGSLFRKWWCYFSPRISSSSRLYGVLPGSDPEAPYGRYLDGRPYKADNRVWGIGQGGPARQLSMINKVPPREPTPVGLAFGFPETPSNAGNSEEPDVLAWKAAARRCGQPTDPPKAT